MSANLYFLLHNLGLRKDYEVVGEFRKTTLSKLLKLAMMKKTHIISSVIFSLLHSVLNLTPIVVTYLVMVEIVKKDFDMSLLREYVFYGVIGIVVSYAFLYAALLLSHLAAFDILYQLRIKISKKLENASLGGLQSKSSGVLKKILVNDVDKLEHFLAHRISEITIAVSAPVVVLAFMFWVDYRLALVSLFPLVLFLVWMYLAFATGGRKDSIRKYFDTAEKMDAVIVEYVRSIKVMKIFNQMAKNYENFTSAIKSYTKMVYDWIDANKNGYSTLLSFMNNALLPILAFSVYMYFQGEINLAVLFLFLILGVGYLKSTLALATLSNSFYESSESLDRIENIIDSRFEMKNEGKNKPKNHNITFENVTFAYDKQEVLKDVDLQIEEGKLTAFVGYSGAGKTTAAELIARFYDVQKGSISIGDVNVKDIEFSYLMQMVSFVFQDNFMFHQSLRENITMGKNVSDDEVINAAKVANAHEFIQALPNGYDTIYGTTAISGGQMQRVQLARIVLKNAPIFILDEATSFNDAKNEYEIRTALNKIIKNKTTIMIAHRLSTIKNADKIVVFSSGSIESIGTHEELLQSSPTYKSMWESMIKAQNFSIKEIA